MLSSSCGVLPRCLPTPRLFKCAPVQQSGEGNYGTANVDGRTSNSVCSPGRHRKWTITRVGNRGRHRFGQKAGDRHPVGWFEGPTRFSVRVLFAGSPGFAKERDHFPIECRDVIQFATGYQLVMGHDPLSTHVPPGLRMSVLSAGHEVSVRRRAASTSTSVHRP